MCRYLVVLPNSILKVICNFAYYAEGYNTDWGSIKAAYAAANRAAKAIRPGLPFLVTTCNKPTLKDDCFKVEVKPIGYHAWCYSEEASACWHCLQCLSNGALWLSRRRQDSGCLLVRSMPGATHKLALNCCWVSAGHAGFSNCLLQGCTGLACSRPCVSTF